MIPIENREDSAMVLFIDVLYLKLNCVNNLVLDRATNNKDVLISN